MRVTGWQRGALTRDIAQLRELTRSIETVHADGTSFLPTFVRDAKRLLGLDSLLAYGLRQGTTETEHITYFSCVGVDELTFRSSLSALVDVRPVTWGLFDSSRPQPDQRNRVLSWNVEEIAVLAQTGQSPVAREVYPVAGVHAQEQMRVVICEGPSLLGWLGGWQRSPIEERQRELLSALVPALRRRLAVERRIELRERRRLDATLEALGSAAVITDERGRLRELNSMARLLLQRDRRGLRDELSAAAISASHPRWRVTRIQGDGGAVELLMIARADGGMSGHVARAATRWGVTDRQREVLAEVVEGHANQTIAAILGISERTVEVHVTALLETAAVESRSALLARVFALA